MVSSTPAGSGLPIGLMPGALPSDHASRQTLNTTAMRFFFGHDPLGLFIVSMLLPCRPAHIPARWIPVRRTGYAPTNKASSAQLIATRPARHGATAAVAWQPSQEGGDRHADDGGRHHAEGD